MRVLIPILGASLSACVGVGPLGGPSDGEPCESDDDCSTGACTTYGVCSHGHCDCPGEECAPEGEPSGDCRSGWVCVGYDAITDPVTEFFGGEPDLDDGYCQVRCDAGCPARYRCGGTFCEGDPDWNRPVPRVAWSGAVEGSFSERGERTEVEVEEGLSIRVEGSATSPVGAPIEALSWTTVSGAGDYVDSSGDAVETFVPEGSYRRVELTARDVEGRSGMVTVVFQGCRGAGRPCGYGGSGCCGSCDEATDTCR